MGAEKVSIVDFQHEKSTIKQTMRGGVIALSLSKSLSSMNLIKRAKRNTTIPIKKKYLICLLAKGYRFLVEGRLYI